MVPGSDRRLILFDATGLGGGEGESAFLDFVGGGEAGHPDRDGADQVDGDGMDVVGLEEVDQADLR